MDAAIKSEASSQLSALRDKFLALAGSGCARSATAADGVAGVQPKLVVAPGTEQEVAEILRISNDARVAVHLRGAGKQDFTGATPTPTHLVFSPARASTITL